MIIAIDPSLSNTAVFIGSGPDDWKHSCFRSINNGPNVAGRIKRYTLIASEVGEFIDKTLKESAVTPAAIFIEGYSFASQQGREQAGENGGILRSELLCFTADIHEVAPGTLKKFATGSGAGSKNLIGAHLAKRYEVLFGSDDEYDAYALYRLGLCAMGVCEPETKAQAEAVAKVMEEKVKKPRKKKAKG
jgi:Holliday junction resolvasome RuvABC endonuclease subunit